MIAMANLQTIAQNVGALVVGLLAGSAANMALISLNSYVLFPPEASLNLENYNDLKTYIAGLPGAAFGTVFAAHWSQTVVGGYLFAMYATIPPSIATQSIAALTMAGSIINLRVLPAPIWTWLEVPIHPILAYLVANTLISDGHNQKQGGGGGTTTKTF